MLDAQEIASTILFHNINGRGFMFANHHHRFAQTCRLTTYRHRFARAAPAPRAKRNDARFKESWTCVARQRADAQGTPALRAKRYDDAKNRGRALPVNCRGSDNRPARGSKLMLFSFRF